MFRIYCTLADLGAGATRDDLNSVFNLMETVRLFVEAMLAHYDKESTSVVEVGYTTGTTSDTQSIDAVYCDYEGSDLKLAKSLCESFTIVVDSVKKDIALGRRAKNEVKASTGSYTPEEFAKLLASAIRDVRALR